MELAAYWFAAAAPATQYYFYAGERYGVTAHSLDDAIRLIRWARVTASFDPTAYDVVEGITFAELEALPGVTEHVYRNMGPMAVRGLWYPYVTATPPSRSELARLAS